MHIIEYPFTQIEILLTIFDMLFGSLKLKCPFLCSLTQRGNIFNNLIKCMLSVTAVTVSFLGFNQC